jgi:hypothetical protein
MNMQTPLLRRSELAPLDVSRELQEEGRASDLFTLVKISPCQTFVSNDPTAEEDVERTPCNITSFECIETDDTSTTTGNGGSSNGPSRVTVEFDYELWTTNPNNLNQTIVQLESSMLQHLAKVFNLLDCPFVSAGRNSGGGRQRHLQVFGDELAELFVGVDSTPLDEPDDEHDECIVPVMESDKVGAVCRPMKGRFSASVNADVSQDSMAEASIKSGLLRLLRLGMNEDLYVLNDVRKVSFIGDRTSFVPPPTVQAASQSTGRSIGSAALAFIILAVLFVFLVAGFLVGRNMKKRKQEQHDMGVVLDESYALDEEEAASPFYNKGFGGEVDGPYGADVQGSLASTDELALQPQPLVVAVLAKSGEESKRGEDSKSEENSEEAGEKNTSDGPIVKPSDAPEKKDSAAADELAAALRMATAAAAWAEKAGEEVTGEKISGEAARPKTPTKKKKKRKKGKRAPDSPDSLLSDSLRKLDSIAEESEPSVIEESDASTRSLT